MKIHLSFVFLFLLTPLFIIAQDFDANLSKYSNDFGQERIYIHFDKNNYAPGDTVWFKAYLMKAIFPDEASKTLYLDWTDDKGNLLRRTSSPLLEAAAIGQFGVPDDFKSRFLHVKAYTKWMLNFDTAFLYNKDISILLKDPTITTKKNAIIPQITFFPEGGNTIAGIINKIAFKANDQWGRPVNVTGVVKNNQGNTIEKLTVIHDGMGYFYLNPKPNENFTAVWKDENKVEHTTPLPSIQSQGVSMQIGMSDNARSFKISASPINENSQLTVLGTMYGQTVFKLVKPLKDGLIEGIVPVKDLPSGIMTITVFDNTMKPLAERITFINNEEFNFSPDLEVAHWGLNKRAKNIIDITVPDSISANLSISVTDVKIENEMKDNIISHFLLTSEIKGIVNNPVYYFENNSDSISKNLDLVMMTNGWRKYNWENVRAGDFPKIIYPRDTSYLSISGQIFGISPIQLRDAGKIILMFNQDKTGNQIYEVPVLPDGSFNDSKLIIFDTAKVFYQLPKLKGRSDASVKFMQNRLPAFTQQTIASGLFKSVDDNAADQYHFKLSTAALKELNAQKGKVLEAITIKAKKTPTLQLMDEKYATGLFSGGDGYQFDLLTDVAARASLSVFDYLQGKVAGLQITQGNPPTLSWRNATPALYLNEMQADVSMIANLSVADIAYIKVLRPPFMGAIGGGAGGAISIYMRRGADIPSTPGKGLSNNTVTGYTTIKQFYSPNYDVISPENDNQDTRTTLFWAPEIITHPGANKATITFFNNDVTQAFKVIIEGVSKEGKLMHFEKILE
ncbi:MAG: hypothetical protein ABI266_00480 [Ginsengibacter sp.]